MQHSLQRCDHAKQSTVLYSVLFPLCRTYCYEHRPHQPVPVPSRFGPFEPISVMCPICLCNVTPDTGIHSLRTPCCKNTWFHRDCIQVRENVRISNANALCALCCYLFSCLGNFLEKMIVIRLGLFVSFLHKEDARPFWFLLFLFTLYRCMNICNITISTLRLQCLGLFMCTISIGTMRNLKEKKAIGTVLSQIIQFHFQASKNARPDLLFQIHCI